MTVSNHALLTHKLFICGDPSLIAPSALLLLFSRAFFAPKACCLRAEHTDALKVIRAKIHHTRLLYNASAAYVESNFSNYVLTLCIQIFPRCVANRRAAERKRFLAMAKSHAASTLNTIQLDFHLMQLFSGRPVRKWLVLCVSQRRSHRRCYSRCRRRQRFFTFALSHLALFAFNCFICCTHTHT